MDSHAREHFSAASSNSHTGHRLAHYSITSYTIASQLHSVAWSYTDKKALQCTCKITRCANFILQTSWGLFSNTIALDPDVVHLIATRSVMMGFRSKVSAIAAACKPILGSHVAH